VLQSQHRVWPPIEQLYHAALEQTLERRSAFLKEACGGDEEMRCEVESLLEQDGEGLLDERAWQESDANLKSGAKLAPYEMLEPIRVGGMRLSTRLPIRASIVRSQGFYRTV
jgi:hypothetical protein